MQINEKCKKDIKIILLGNKTDLEENRKVSSEEGANFAVEKGYTFMETSCLENRNVADSFETLIELTYRENLNIYANQSENTITIKNSQNNKKNCC